MSSDSRHDEIMAKLTTVFHDVFDDDNIVLTDNTSAVDIPGWDSLMHITLCVATERAFNTRLSAPEIAGLSNVGEMVKFLAERCS